MLISGCPFWTQRHPSGCSVTKQGAQTAWRSWERWGRRQGAASFPHHIYLSLWKISSSSSLQSLDIHLPEKSCDTKESHESFALHENMKALTWDHRFLWNDTVNPCLYACNRSRSTENEILNCGVWDQWFSQISWVLQISLFAIFVFPSSVLEKWFLHIFFVVVLCLAQHTSARRN